MASKGSIAARAATARERLAKAMGRLSEQSGVPLPGGTTVPLRQPELRAVAELERVADFLDRLAGPDEPKEEPAPSPAAPPAREPEPTAPPAETDDEFTSDEEEDDEPVIHGNPLSFYDGMTDEDILGIKGIGRKTLDQIREAQAGR